MLAFESSGVQSSICLDDLSQCSRHMAEAESSSALRLRDASSYFSLAVRRLTCGAAGSLMSLVAEFPGAIDAAAEELLLVMSLVTGKR